MKIRKADGSGALMEEPLIRGGWLNEYGDMMLTGLGVNELILILIATFMLVKLPRIAHHVFGQK